jgi:hypothetical protein
VSDVFLGPWPFMVGELTAWVLTLAGAFVFGIVIAVEHCRIAAMHDLCPRCGISWTKHFRLDEKDPCPGNGWDDKGFPARLEDWFT